MPIRELSVELVSDIVESYGQITKLNLSTNGELSEAQRLLFSSSWTRLQVAVARGSQCVDVDYLTSLLQLLGVGCGFALFHSNTS